MPPHDLRRWLTEKVADHLRMPPADIDPAVKLRTYGMESIHAITLCVDIEETLGLLVDPTLAYDHPTIDALTAHLSELLPPPQTNTPRPLPTGTP
ncbi:Phosphopantetheine attachment site [Sinosporangium album]|uniref:Phosphopantetheine attachment site n=1 Tax=Sinosporangium album TaxID=504805 RepID=A0A1G7ZP47_9ACTN|nr:acyl carrier protein [Sinosporangium album]SDH10552.1 Phosphopantetheine attachment site [Sinosporangium album]